MNIKNAVVPLVIIAVVISVFYFQDKKQRELIDALFVEYPIIQDLDSINGRITDIYIPSQSVTNNNPHDAYVVLDNLLKRTVFVGLEIRTDSTLDEVISVGSTLLKRANSDTLLIVAPDSVTSTFIINN